MENDLREEINQQIEKQTEELERRFNQFLMELEQDFDFVPSAIAENQNNNSAIAENQNNNWDDVYTELEQMLPELDGRLENIEKRYGSVALKYNLVLGLTSLVMFSVLGYLGYVLFR